MKRVIRIDCIRMTRIKNAYMVEYDMQCKMPGQGEYDNSMYTSEKESFAKGSDALKRMDELHDMSQSGDYSKFK